MTAEEKRRSIENRVMLAKCCSADLGYRIKLGKALGQDVTCLWAKLLYVQSAIDSLSCYTPVGAVTHDAVRARVVIRLSSVTAGSTFTVTIKNGATVLLTASALFTTTTVSTALKLLSTSVNALFPTTGYSASYGYDNGNYYNPDALTVYAPKSLGTAANNYTVEITTAGGAVAYSPDHTQLRFGKDPALETYNNYTEKEAEEILQKLEELCDNCCKADSELLDDTIHDILL